MEEKPKDENISALLDISRRFSKINWRKKNILGLQTSELRLLFLLYSTQSNSDKKGRTISEISKSLDVTSPTVTQIVNNLLKKNCVKRSIAPDDRRVCYVSLTKKGKEMADKELEKHRSLLSGLVNYLGKAQSEQLVFLLDQTLNYIENQEAECSDS